MSEPTRNEKDEKQEKGNGESWDEKWRRDPVEAAVWACILIWVGLVWLLNSTQVWSNLFGDGIEAWTIGFLGAGLIVLLGVVFRLVVPGYRRPVLGSIILGIVLLGIGLGELVNWVAVGAVVLIAIGVAILLRGFVGKE
ncbi:MAG: hypothetical protein P8189_22725 [Anaerolineae bacterium]|jgi:hypothetical protein